MLFLISTYLGLHLFKYLNDDDNDVNDDNDDLDSSAPYGLEF